MRTVRLGPLFVVSLLFSGTAVQAQQSPAPVTPTRDPTAIVLLQKSVAAMAPSAPSDSSATGNITIVEGSTTESGSLSIRTLGTGDTAETINLPDGQRAVIYSNGDAREVIGSKTTNPPLELSVTDQCPDFPLPLLLSVLNSADEAYQYVGQETLSGESVQHIKVWDTFASNVHLQKLAAFSARDIWFDSASGLPVKLAYVRQAGEGAVPRFRVEVFFSSYTNVNGVRFPFQIKKSYNGTPWETITIQNVSFNSGLMDSDFQVD